MRRITLVLVAVALVFADGCADAPAPVVSSDILVQPEMGSYLTDYWQQETDIMLVDASVSNRSCGKDYRTRFMYPGVDLKAGEACLVVAGHVENHAKRQLEIGMFARGYDENGVWVAETLDSDGVYGSITFDIEPGETRDFLLHLNPSDRVRTIQVFGGPYKNRRTGLPTPVRDEPFTSSTPLPESEMTRITFSRKWLLENDQDPGESYVKITFPESWLREPPHIPEDEAVEVRIPTLWLKHNNESDNPDEITASFSVRFFNGL